MAHRAPKNTDVGVLLQKSSSSLFYTFIKIQVIGLKLGDDWKERIESLYFHCITKYKEFHFKRCLLCDLCVQSGDRMWEKKSIVVASEWPKAPEVLKVMSRMSTLFDNDDGSVEVAVVCQVVRGGKRAASDFREGHVADIDFYSSQSRSIYFKHHLVCFCGGLLPLSFSLTCLDLTVGMDGGGETRRKQWK